jgi:hypothetical protein
MRALLPNRLEFLYVAYRPKADIYDVRFSAPKPSYIETRAWSERRQELFAPSLDLMLVHPLALLV